MKIKKKQSTAPNKFKSEIDKGKEKKSKSNKKLRIFIIILFSSLIICSILIICFKNLFFLKHDDTIIVSKTEAIEKIILDTLKKSQPVQLKSEEINNELKSIFKRTIEKDGNSFIITIKADIETQKGFARIKEKLPLNLAATAIESSGAVFKSDSDYVKFIWLDLSDSINEILVKYQIPIVNEIDSGDMIVGEFTSENLINNSDNNAIQIPKTFFNFKKPISEEVIKNDDITKNTTQALKNNTFKYHLIAGSFKKKTNAKKLFKKLKKQGYDARFLGKIGEYYKVSFISFKDRSQADKRKEKMTDNGVSTWIQDYIIEF